MKGKNRIRGMLFVLGVVIGWGFLYFILGFNSYLVDAIFFISIGWALRETLEPIEQEAIE